MSGLASNAQWYLARDGQQFGPLSDAEMAKFVELGHLKPTDLLWREGFPDWRPALVVFPPHASPLPGDTRLTPGEAGLPPRMMAEPLASPAPEDRAGYVEKEHRRRPGVLARIARLLLLVAVLAAAAGAAYLYREPLTALVVSFSQPSSGPPIAERRSLELPPLAGFRAGSGEAVDAALQSTALWKVIKREFPDWYKERIAEAMQLSQEGKDDAVIGQLIGRKLSELRRKHAGSGIAASEERLKTVATAYLDTIKRLRSHNPEACAGFIRRGEAEPLIVTLLQQGSEHTGHLQAQLTTVFEAIADGRQTPRVHIRPTAEHEQLLESELIKRGWTGDDFKLFVNLAQAPPEKTCQLVHDFFAAQFAVRDPEAQTRLLLNWLRRVFIAS